METCYKAFRLEVIQLDRGRGGPLRLRAGDHRQGRRRRLARLRGRHRLRRPDLRRGQEDHVARRRRAPATGRSVLATCGDGYAGHLDRVPGPQRPTRGVRRRRRRARPTVFALTRRGDELHGLDLQPRRAPPRRRRARDRRRPRRAHRALQRGRAVTATDLRRVGRPAANTIRRRPATSTSVSSTSRRRPGRLYDSVVLVNVLEHIDDDATPSRSSGASLRPGGRVCVFVPAFDGLYSTSTSASATGGGTAGSHLVSVLDRAGFDDRRRALHQHRRCGRLVDLRPSARPGADPTLVGLASTTDSSSRRCGGSRPAAPEVRAVAVLRRHRPGT